MGAFSGGTIAGNILPDATGRDLGSTTQRWDVFAQNINTSGTTNGIRIVNVDNTGNVDVTAAIQTILDANDYVYFPPGTYKVTAALRVSRSGMHIDGAPTAIIKGYGAINIFELGDGSVGSGFQFAGINVGSMKNIQINAADATVLRAIYARGAREWDFFEVKVQGVSNASRSFVTAGVEVRESWDQRWTNCRVQYCLGDGFYFNNTGSPAGNSNDIDFCGTWSAHNDGRGFYFTAGGGIRGDFYGEDNTLGGLETSGVQGFKIRGGYFESNVPFDIKIGGSSSGVSISGIYMNNTTSNNHTNVILVGSGSIALSGLHSTFGAVGQTGAKVIDVQAGTTNVTIENVQSATSGAVVTVRGGAAYTTGVVCDTDSLGARFPAGVSGSNSSGTAASLEVLTGLNVAGTANFGGTGSGATIVAIKAAKQDTAILDIQSTGDNTNNGINLNNLHSNAAARNWGLVMNQTTPGDFAIKQSNAKGGDPFSAGTNRLYFDASGNAQIPGSLKIGGGTSLTKAVVYSQTVTPSAVGAATVAEQTFTVTGLTTADKVIVNPAATGNATAAVSFRVSAADTLAVQFVNPTAGSLTPAAGTWNIVALRS